jgi:hypothetical protein
VPSTNPSTPRSVLIFTVHKAASMFLHAVTRDTAHALSIPYHSTNNDEQFPEIRKQSWQRFVGERRELACFGQIRPGEADPCIPADLGKYSILLHLRDPRDVLTSLYYSVTFSHSRREGGFNPSDAEREEWERQGVDGYVLENAPVIRERYELLLREVHGRPNVVHTRYEDLVSDYRAWLSRFLSVFEHLPEAQRRSGLLRETRLARLRRELVKRHADAFDVGGENVRVHKRQVKPGDHLRKLKPETIARLDDELAHVLSTLAYPRSAGVAHA